MSPLKVVGIIGDPVSHSLSPQMQNAAFKRLKLKWTYLPFHVRDVEMESFLSRVREGEMEGFNVTIPHKETIMPYLDHISPEARAIGAVNTVVREGKKLKGYNTDASGYLRSLKEEVHFNPKGKNIVVLGAGGAARAVVYVLAFAGAKNIFIQNRTRSRALKLAKDFKGQFLKTTKIRTVQSSARHLWRDIFSETDLVINATSLGLVSKQAQAEDHRLLLPFEALPKKAIVSDLVYRPLMTPFLKLVEQKGVKTHSGLGMLLYQGAQAFSLWTGKAAPIAVMKKALLDALKRNC